ncbi:proteasome assembly chaperone family protein [Nanoarchaeota archaeon]
MKVILKKKPKNPVIIEGFPGFGLVGTITTEYLLNELKAEVIGSITSEKLPPMVAIHDNKTVEPIGIYYVKKFNLVLLHVMTNVKGLEWEMSEALVDLAKQLEASDIISIEGVGTPVPEDEVHSFYFSNNPAGIKKFKDAKIPPLKEGIILGVTATLLLQAEQDLSSIFVETHSNLPDSKAAAKAVEVLDKYLGLSIDYKPLLKQAEKFEEKIKKMMQQQGVATEEQKKKQLSYVG